MKLRYLMVGIAFIAGIIASNLLAGATTNNTKTFEIPQSTGQETEPTPQMPQDRISEDQITVRRDRVVLDLQNAQWSRFTDTDSMTPFLDKGANAIQVEPKKKCRDIEKGDIISYESSYTDTTVIHRVIEKGKDEKGKYFIAKGDNNDNPDPEPVRCSQIKRVLVAIIY